MKNILLQSEIYYINNVYKQFHNLKKDYPELIDDNKFCKLNVRKTLLKINKLTKQFVDYIADELNIILYEDIEERQLSNNINSNKTPFLFEFRFELGDYKFSLNIDYYNGIILIEKELNDNKFEMVINFYR